MGKLFFSATVTGVNVDNVWIEITSDKKQWKQYGRFCYSPPYIFTLDPMTLPKKRFSLRAVASDEFGNIGTSNVIELMNQ